MEVLLWCITYAKAAPKGGFCVSGMKLYSKHMITPEQEKWLAHLSITNATVILPYDSDAPRKFELIKNRVEGILGIGIRVLHKGASSLNISGQGELDVYVPVSPEDFNSTFALLEKEFGTPRSHYPLDRACFVLSVEGTKTELFIINKEGRGWIDSEIFEEYLKTHPEALADYQKLKEQGAGLSTQEYYRRKIEFINEILSKAKQ